MVKDVIHDPILLGSKSDPATKDDLHVAQDLLDTLIANKDGCVGMAANMIGVHRRIIVFDNEGTYMTMFNPEIVKKQILCCSHNLGRSPLAEEFFSDHFHI